MTRKIRAFSRPRGVTCETVQKTFQDRFLLKPDPELNRGILRTLSRALSLYPVRLHAVVCLGNHWHLLATYDDVEQMAAFHCYFSAGVSRWVRRVHGWDDRVFPRRYSHVELSQEPEVEPARLRYLLSQGCKEGLVASPLDWPGVSSTSALVAGRSMELETGFEVKLSPLPSLAHLSPGSYGKLVLGLVKDIEAETEASHRLEGSRPVGVQGIMAGDPLDRPKEVKRSPGPWVHAMDPALRKSMKTALAWIYASFRDASSKLRKGDRDVVFPTHTFPPGLPFVRDGSALTRALLCPD